MIHYENINLYREATEGGFEVLLEDGSWLHECHLDYLEDVNYNYKEA